jgi:transposase
VSPTARQIERLAEALQEPGSGLPAAVIALCQVLFAHIAALAEQVGLLERELRERARRDEAAKRLMTIPGVGVICAIAIEPLAPPSVSFAKGRDFAAWLGLTPRQNSLGGKARLGGTSKMGQRDLRRLLVSGAMTSFDGLCHHRRPFLAWQRKAVRSVFKPRQSIP